MKRAIQLLLLSGLLAIMVPAQDDWPRLLAETGKAADFPGAGYVVVRERTSVKVQDSGLSYVTRETFYKILTARGAVDLQTLTFGYDPLSAAVEVQAAAVYRPGQAERPLPLELVADYPAPARAIYWGAREKALPVGRLEPGDGLYVKTFQKGFTYALLAGQSDEDRYIPPMRGHFYDIVPFYADVPVLLKSYQVRLPATKTLQFEFYNGEARHWAHREGDEMVYHWEKTDLKPVETEPMGVDLSDIAPELLVSTSPDWQAKSRWFFKVNEDYGSFEADADIRQKVNEVLQGAGGTWERISRLTHWVAEEIRYSGISMGEGEGFTLHKGSMTFLDRCGVCKDKAGMLITMLRAAGFESYPAMTMAGSRIDPIPADQFNHCVTIVKVDGEYHLLDPTWVPGVRELWSSAEQQQEYLMGVPEGAGLMSTPVSPPEKHYLKYRIDSTLSADGTLQGHFLITAEGQSDSTLRGLLSRRPRQTWPAVLEQVIRSVHPAIRFSGVTHPDPVNLDQPFEIRFDFEIPGYALTGERQLYVRPVIGRLPFRQCVYFANARLGASQRKQPFRTRCSQLFTVEETMQLPPGWTAVELPVQQAVDGPGAGFDGSVKVENGRLLVRQEVRLKKRIYEPADWDSFKKSVQEFMKLTERDLVFGK